MPSISDINARHGQSMDALIGAFEQHLGDMVRRATARVTGILQRDLSITDGVIDATPANNRILRRLDKLFAQEMDEDGYGRLVQTFVAQFPTQLPFFDEVLEYLHERLPEVPATLQFTAQDIGLLKSFQLNAIAGIEGTVEAMGGLVMRGAMFSVGGLKFSDLVETLSEKYATSIPRATTMAETAQMVFYRTATDRAFQAIEEDVPQLEAKYEYGGPLDSRNRPFCKHLMLVKKSYTRAEIAQMDNGMIPNVWLSAGGWACRHSWFMSV